MCAETWVHGSIELIHSEWVMRVLTIVRVLLHHGSLLCETTSIL